MHPRGAIAQNVRFRPLTLKGQVQGHKRKWLKHFHMHPRGALAQNIHGHGVKWL